MLTCHPGRTRSQHAILEDLSQPLRQQIQIRRSSQLLEYLGLKLSEWNDHPIAGAIAAGLTRQVFMHLDYMLHEGRDVPGLLFINAGEVDLIRFKRDPNDDS